MCVCVCVCVAWLPWPAALFTDGRLWQVQELEKHRFVLEFRAKELKEALEPQQQVNAQLQEDKEVCVYPCTCVNCY